MADGFPVTFRLNILRGSYDGLGLVDSSFSYRKRGEYFLLHFYINEETHYLSKCLGFFPTPPNRSEEGWFKWPICVCNPLKQPHRAHAGVFNIHPYRVGHHFIVICVVIGDNAEGWHHILGDWNDEGNQYLASCAVSAMGHQLTSAWDLERNIHLLADLTRAGALKAAVLTQPVLQDTQTQNYSHQVSDVLN